MVREAQARVSRDAAALRPRRRGRHWGHGTKLNLPTRSRSALAWPSPPQRWRYDEKVSYTGPVYESAKVERTPSSFRSPGRRAALGRDDRSLRGFTVAGDDRRFVPADAVVRDDAVIVSSPHVPHPVAVRYGWADYPSGDLADRSGLPAAPFRSDDFPPLPSPPPRAGEGGGVPPKPDDAPTRPLTRGVPGGAVKVDVPGVQQRDDYSCGAAALMAVCSYFGVGPDDLEEYKKKLGTNEENGTNVYHIRNMARGLGLEADIHHGMTLDELRKRLDEGARSSSPSRLTATR